MPTCRMEQAGTYKRRPRSDINIQIILGIIKANWMQALLINDLSEKFQQPKIATNSGWAQKLKPSGNAKNTIMKSRIRENIFTKQRRIDRST